MRNAWDLRPFDGIAGATSYDLPTNDVNSFVGFVSDVAFTTFEISSAATAWRGIDNVETPASLTMPAPEPGSTVLLGLGAITVFGGRRKRVRS